MSRRERARETTVKLAACVLPTGALVAAMFAVGGTPAAVTMLVFGGLAAVIGGALLTVGLFALLLFFAYVRGA
jgi:ABC-type multidrug transport system permease subunit